MMRRFTLRKNQPWLKVLAISQVLLANAPIANSTAVYLRVESQFPSGHYTRSLLVKRTKKVQIQRWFHVQTKDKGFGWIAEDQLLDALKLCSEARLIETTPFRSERDLDLMPKTELPKDSVVKVLEIRGSWAQVRSPLAKTGWVLTEALDAIIPSASASLDNQNIFIPRNTILYAQTIRQGRIVEHISSATIGTVLRAHSPRKAEGWLEVRTRKGSQGFLLRSEVITATDLGKLGARTLNDLSALRSVPIPYAHRSRHIQNGHHLKILGSQTLRWGLARLSEGGEVWWPITNEASDIEREIDLSESISTSELFRRKIFDMASSPAIPSLKFVSAQGVFRTIDGKEWTKIPVFQDKNYPIAIAGLGSIFVGPFVSDDHGETFEQWIRWDTLIASMKRIRYFSPKQLQIQEIRPEDPTGRRVVLKLSVGTEALVKLVTDDQGRSWRPL
jgi:hypothetical protein